VQQHAYTFIKIITDKIIKSIWNLFYPVCNVGLFE
jgi:hypothetical protein